MLTGVLLSAAFITLAFGQCPKTFFDAGEVSASAPDGDFQEVTVTRDLLLPKGIRIDTTYLQKAVTAASDGAGSEMRAAQIPPGLFLIASGEKSGKWAIDNPKLETVSGQLRFRIELWANSGHRDPGAARVPGVRVRVCVKTER